VKGCVFEDSTHPTPFPVAEDFTMRKGEAGRVGPTLMCTCPTCGKPTPHRSEGVDRREREPDGRVFQWMECAVCRTSTKVPFTEGTNEFQENLDTPNDLDA